MSPWRRACAEPLDVLDIERPRLTMEAEPGTRYFIRQIERHGGRVVKSCEGHAPRWRFYVSFAAGVSTARRILHAGHFDVQLLRNIWMDEQGVEFPVWALMLPNREPSESELHTELAQAAEDWERYLGYLYDPEDLQFMHPEGRA